ncbi:ABC transporter ATP-binding protein [Paenibacillus sp. FSL A5-0031]|uniref:ABC transporter ATP-binding protein n=1 Tax=Paenibacillus sp. FSL A5-0031 TaxID=1920420 RepID=UPI00096F872B|nr:ABC transporter ATP-binding protein [Paenibacillus sp. FSL A5-0031]OME72037.1 ABC transporter ATP-binding protein [Paenibacillus sp. FSL A5-0031]
MLTMFTFLKKYRFAAYVALLLMLVELVVELLQPYIISKIIDDGIDNNNLSVVLQWGGFLIGCSVIAFIVGILSSFYASHVSQSFGFDLRERLYEKVQSFSFANFNRFPESSLITRLTNDVSQLQNTVFMGLRIMLRAPLLVIGSIVMAFIVQPKLAIWLAAVIPFLGVFLLWVLKKGEKLFRSVQKQLDQVNSVMQQNLIGMRIVRVFVRMKHESKRFAFSSEQLMDRTVSALRLTEVTMPIVLLFMNAIVIAVLWFGRIELDRNGASVGEVVAIVNYAMRTIGALSIMSMIVVNFSRARASAQRIEEVVLTDIDLTDTVDSDEAVKLRDGYVSFENVSFEYPDSDLHVLRDISFSVLPGETIAIMGATGSGKTSLIQLIPRLYDVQTGVIRVDGKDNRLMKLEQLRKQIGYVPQEIMLFTGTVADNIRWGKENASIEEIIEAAKLAQIHDTIMKLPEQYDTIVGQKGVNLSGGQKQRLTIARALVRKPVVLLLDDSTSALDVQTEAALLQALKNMSCTTFLITQKISSTVAADSILLLDEGQLLAQGKHDQLIRESSLYQKIYESQFGKEGVSRA